jgi:hypothetical protein
MNANNIRTAGLYLSGAVIGGLVGAVIGSLIVDLILAKENEENGYLEDQEEEEEVAEEEITKEPSKEEKKPMHIEKLKQKRNEAKLDYTKFSKINDGKSQNDLAELVQKYSVEEKTEEQDENLPHVISLEEWTNGGGPNEKITLTYYEVDDTVADPNDDIFQNVEKLLGDDSLLSFGIDSDDPDIVYVRNNKISTDFEIIRVRKSYSETVLGIIPEPKKRIKKVKKQDAEE